jgi:hypothetical protein
MLTTHEAFNVIMETLCSSVENDNQQLDATVVIKLTKKECKVIVSSDICLDNIDSTVFDVKLTDKSTTITFTAK